MMANDSSNALHHFFWIVRPVGIYQGLEEPDIDEVIINMFVPECKDADKLRIKAGEGRRLKRVIAASKVLNSIWDSFNQVGTRQ